MKPVFSVIVPIYKVEEYLPKCVESILAQTYRDFELLLVDDGSPDNCPAMCDEFARQDERVRVIHKENGGLVSARNAGIHAAVGEYICYVDGDDWIASDLLEKLYTKAVETHAPDMIIYRILKVFSDHEEEVPEYLAEGFYDKRALETEIVPRMMYDDRHAFCKGLIFPAACNKAIKRELLLEHYCRDERIRMGEDNAYVFECVYHANSLFVCHDLAYFYNRANDGSITNTYDSKRFRNNQYLTEYIDSRIGGKSNVVDGQINAFKAYWLMMAITHEMKTGQPLFKARRHIRREIQQTGVLNGITMAGLPKIAKLYLALLKMHLYGLCLIGAKLISVIRK